MDQKHEFVADLPNPVPQRLAGVACYPAFVSIAEVRAGGLNTVESRDGEPMDKVPRGQESAANGYPDIWYSTL